MLTQTLEGIRYAANHPGIGPMLVVLTALAMSVKTVSGFAAGSG